MAEWLYEAGIGESRAALIDGGAIVEMAIDRDDGRIRAGTVLDARLTRRPDASGRGLVGFAGGEARLLGAPAGLTEGARLRVEIIREPLPEAGGTKPAHARAVASDAPLGPGPDLRARLGQSGLPVRETRAAGGLLDALGWGDSLEEAASGLVARDDALLRISPTPAMTLIDVDGAGAPAALAIAGARRAAQAIRRFDITGSIGIDLPTLAGKADRQAAAKAIDDVLPQPFERTAVNGFGFLQIVRRRIRASIVEQLRADPALTAALGLLRAAERALGHGGLTLSAAPAAIARIEARPDWQYELARLVGARVALRPDAGLSISAAHADRDHPL